VFPLVILAVPILDSSFVIAKRIKYGRPVYEADRWHFHHRFANIGFSRRTVLYLYGWTSCGVLTHLRHPNTATSTPRAGLVIGGFFLAAAVAGVPRAGARDPEAEALQFRSPRARSGGRPRASGQAASRTSWRRASSRSWGRAKRGRPRSLSQPSSWLPRLRERRPDRMI
jgi:hypothetical protein